MARATEYEKPSGLAVQFRPWEMGAWLQARRLNEQGPGYRALETLRIHATLMDVAREKLRNIFSEQQLAALMEAAAPHLYWRDREKLESLPFLLSDRLAQLDPQYDRTMGQLLRLDVWMLAGLRDMALEYWAEQERSA